MNQKNPKEGHSSTMSIAKDLATKALVDRRFNFREIGIDTQCIGQGIEGVRYRGGEISTAADFDTNLMYSSHISSLNLERDGKKLWEVKYCMRISDTPYNL